MYNIHSPAVSVIALLASVACSTGSGHPSKDAGVGTGGGNAGGASGTGGGGGGGAGASTTTPPACGAFEAVSEEYYRTPTLMGTVWSDCNTDTTTGTHTAIEIYEATAGAPICARGQVVRPSAGWGWAILGFDTNVGTLLGSSANDDAGVDAGDAAGASSAYLAWNSYVPRSEGLTVGVNNKAQSPLWLCLQGANFEQWCVKDVKDGDFYHWTDFIDENGTGLAYALQPIVSIQFTLPDGTGPFDFCVNGFTESAAFCACPGGTCVCPTGMSACSGTCVADTSLNPLNCGACGHVCGASAVCRDADCTDSLYGPMDLPDALAVDAAGLYYTLPVRGFVMRAPLEGGTPEVLASGQNTPVHIVVANGVVYFANAGTQSANYADGAIMKLEGTAPTPLAQAQNNVGALAVNANHVFWLNMGTRSAGYVDGAVMRVDLASGVQEQLATNVKHPRSIALDANHLYWAEQGSGSWGNATADGRVMMRALDSTAVAEPLATNLLAPMALAVDANNLYVAGAEKIIKISLADRSIVTLATGQSQPFAIAVDATDVYWTDLFSGSLVTVPIAGGTAPVALAKGQAYAVGLALSATDVYFTTQTEAGIGGVQKLAK